jgi:hypothetical protein
MIGAQSQICVDLRLSAVKSRLFLRSFAAIPTSEPPSLCAFASLADEAKGGDGAKSALREIFLSLWAL